MELREHFSHLCYNEVAYGGKRPYPTYFCLLDWYDYLTDSDLHVARNYCVGNDDLTERFRRTIVKDWVSYGSRET